MGKDRGTKSRSKVKKMFTHKQKIFLFPLFHSIIFIANNGNIKQNFKALLTLLTSEILACVCVGGEDRHYFFLNDKTRRSRINKNK